MSIEVNRHWTTADEIKFVRGIGKHCEGSLRCSIAGRRGLLERYIAAGRMRDWGDLDGNKILIFAQEELVRL